MSAERLREAAKLMRERADLPYVAGEWEVVGGVGIHRSSNSPRISHPWHAEAKAALYDPEDERVVNEAIAEHIASWHPAVARTVADWLVGESLNPSAWNLAALAVADAYLGDPS